MTNNLISKILCVIKQWLNHIIHYVFNLIEISTLIEVKFEDTSLKMMRSIFNDSGDQYSAPSWSSTQPSHEKVVWTSRKNESLAHNRLVLGQGTSPTCLFKIT